MAATPALPPRSRYTTFEAELTMGKAVINLSAESPVLPSFPDYGICILESRHGHRFRMAKSRYDFSEVMLIIEGAGWILHQGQRRPVQRGDVIAVEAGELYSFEDKPKSPLAMLTLCIRPPAAHAALYAAVLPRRFQLYRHPAFSREVASDLRTILHQQLQAKATGPQIVVAHSLLLLEKLRRFRRYREAEPAPMPALAGVELAARVRFYIDQLETRFHEPESIEQVARRLGISPRAFTDHFRRITGVTRGNYLRDLRLRHARRLLADTRQPITSIAFACGFEDLSSFFRVFRQAEGVSPRQWRAQHEP
ncbi:MAG: AraC family transcriptional regulator [Puniceicoccaceae bacterium]|nr:MAG: AraC family transcriptional regulator [Puniceicoccaceae bacterium]